MADVNDPARRGIERLGTVLAGKWRLERLIGVGGMASVYEASHRNGAIVAVKVLHPEFARSADPRSRFMREGYLANRAGPGAVRVLDDDVDDDGSPFLVMDLLSGEPVEARAARRGGRLSILEVLWVAGETLATLEIAHSKGIIHRDLKPANLFWTHDDRLMILDFGIARVQQETGERTMAGTILGTLGFMAHEQATGRTAEIDARTDIWAIGAIMFHLLIGGSVHPTGKMNELVAAATQPARSIATADATVPREVADIIDCALQFEQKDRYPTARAMREAIAAITREGELKAALRQYRFASPSPSAAVDSVANTAYPSNEVAHVSSSGLATGMSDDDSLALRHLFRLIELSMLSRRELEARDDPASIEAAQLGSFRQLDLAHRHAVNALAAAHIGLFWNVLPEGFATRHGLLWGASPPLAATPAAMFEGGVRMLGLLPGLAFEELEQVVRMMRGDLTPFTDYATFIRSSELPHLVYRLDPTRPEVPDHPSLAGDASLPDETSLRAILDGLPTSDPPLRAALLKRLERIAAGYEGMIGSALATAGAEVGVSLLRVLTTLGTEASREAMRSATENPSAIVRIEALARLDPSGAPLQAELRDALATGDSRDRIDRLVQVAVYGTAAAASPLVARIRSGSFDKLPPDERRQAFATLSILAPARAEAIAAGLLGDQRVISTDAHETTRALACEILGRCGRSREARDALESAVKSRTKTSERVRVAASVALGAFDARRGGLP